MPASNKDCERSADFDDRVLRIYHRAIGQGGGMCECGVVCVLGHSPSHQQGYHSKRSYKKQITQAENNSFFNLFRFLPIELWRDVPKKMYGITGKTAM